MYGFTIALYIAGVKHTDLYLQLMSQPPWDTNLDFKPGKPFQIIHYTYGMDYKLDGGSFEALGLRGKGSADVRKEGWGALGWEGREREWLVRQVRGLSRAFN
jgi:hypothetical protein